MNLTTLIILVSGLLSLQIFADPPTERLQNLLKAQGFFYGDSDGKSSPEMVAALRRYQIRNGLEVTGTVNDQTRAALGLVDDQGSTKPKPSPEPLPPITSETPQASRPLDPSQPSAVASSLAGEATELSQIFAGTPYFTAPGEVQTRTLANAQTALAGFGYYRGTIDGIFGPATEEALLIFQGNFRIKLSGRLDLSTLAALRLLPVRSGVRMAIPPPTMPRTYRGSWVE